MAGNFYFRDRNGKELKNHKLQGIPMSGMGSAVATNGDLVCNRAENVKWFDGKGRIARTEIWGFTCLTGEHEYPHITIDDFAGHNAVLVKFWCPRSEYNEEFWLIGPDGCDKIREACERKSAAVA